ncbi:MAG: DUF4465 domain-containing protein [Actinomycetia bacterium]|nr:DUF4465 domain-containing protein [Actinomycetes bacterium]
MFRKLIFVMGLLVIAGIVGAAPVAGFDDNPLAPETYWNGSDGSGGFTSGNAWFNNNYDSTWGSWDGWSYSNTTDTTTPGYMNQYSAITGGGAGGSANYGVSYVSSWAAAPTLSLTDTTDGCLLGAYFTNTTYAYLSMRDGDSMAKKFGGASGNDEDWFKLTITGIRSDATYTDPLDFYLADYRFADNSQDYMVDDWTWVDMSGLGSVIGLEFALSSSDVGAYGMNTPAYFAMDDLTAVPEPASITFFGLGLAGIAAWRRRRRKTVA